MSHLRTIACLIAFSTFLHSAGAGTLVQFRTVFGDMEVELYDKDKPVTVQNFLNYIKSGRYENEIAHRLILGSVLQGGGYTLVSNTITPIVAFPPITNEYGVGQQYSNVFGTIAMAKNGGDTNSATSQWYFNLANNAMLDAPNTNDYFVVFGHVIAGTNILNIFNGFQYWTANPAPSPTNLVLYDYYGPPLDTLPVLTSNFPPPASSFVFVDISLLQVAIQPANGGGKQISWNSATGLTNIVEYTTNFPPVWNTLITTNGTGAQMSVVDSAVAPSRFYRVRVVD